MFKKAINSINMLNREKILIVQTSFQNLWLIRDMKDKKIQNFSSIPLKLCLLGKKTGTWGVNPSIIVCNSIV